MRLVRADEKVAAPPVEGRRRRGGGEDLRVKAAGNAVRWRNRKREGGQGVQEVRKLTTKLDVSTARAEEEGGAGIRRSPRRT
jgi:hypothetical protein